MRIDGIDGIGRPKQAETTRSTQSSERTDPLEPQQAGDRLELSDQARKVAALAEKAAGLPDVRREKIEALQRALDDGSYQVDARQLAKKILEFEDAFAG